MTTEPKYKALRNGMIPDDQDRDRMLFRIENGKHVFIDWKIKLQYLMKRQFVLNSRCDLALGNLQFATLPNCKGLKLIFKVLKNFSMNKSV